MTDFCMRVGQALITVSNHVAALDDPLVTAALLPPGAFLSPRALRWTLCATDRCFTSPAATAFFRAAKVGQRAPIITVKVSLRALLPGRQGSGIRADGHADQGLI